MSFLRKYCYLKFIKIRGRKRTIFTFHRKNIRKLVVMTLLLILLLPAVQTSVADAESKTVLGVSSVYTDRASYVELAVFIDSTEKIAGGSFDLSYDPGLLNIPDTAVSVSSALDGYLKSFGSDNNGTVSVSFAAAEGQQIQDDLVALKVRVTKAKVDTAVKLENVQLFNENGEEISMQVIHGAIRPFDGEVEEHPGTVQPDKVWKVTLSDPYDMKSLNEHAVKVTRGTVDVPVTVKAIDPYTFEVRAKNGYTTGKHTLEITDQIISAKGTKLVSPVQKNFTVAR